MSFGFYEVSDLKGFGLHYGKILNFFVRVITVHLQKFEGCGTRLLLQYKILLYAQSCYIHFLSEIPAYVLFGFFLYAPLNRSNPQKSNIHDATVATLGRVILLVATQRVKRPPPCCFFLPAVRNDLSGSGFKSATTNNQDGRLGSVK